MKFIDLTGKRFGKLTVLKRVIKINSKKTYFLCKCECGKIKTIYRDDIVSGKTISCGCHKKEMARKLGKSTKTHGMTQTRLYHIWRGSRDRCQNKRSKDYKNYGGRGITICAEWEKSFESFYDWAMSHGYRDNLTIDRIDVNGNYCPENCRWADINTQSHNKRNNVNITINGETKCSTEWERILGISRHTVKKRYLKGAINV